MIKYLKEYRFYITLFIFLLIPIIAIDTTTRTPRDYRFYDKVIIWITSPIQTTISWTLDQAVTGVNRYLFLWNTQKNNQALYEENRTLLQTIVQMKEAENENKRLKDLLHFKEQLQLDSVIARVIAIDVSTEFRSIRVNRGESEGVKKGMPVITEEGIVGRVFRTTSGTADIVTLLDPLSAVDAIIERSRTRGVVEGMTEEFCSLKFTLRTDDIEVGDLLISSGLGGVFPKGVPVGVVTQVDKKKFGITQDVQIRPSVDFTKLEEVMIVTHQVKTKEI